MSLPDRQDIRSADNRVVARPLLIFSVILALILVSGGIVAQIYLKEPPITAFLLAMAGALVIYHLLGGDVPMEGQRWGAKFRGPTAIVALFVIWVVMSTLLTRSTDQTFLPLVEGEATPYQIGRYAVDVALVTSLSRDELYSKFTEILDAAKRPGYGLELTDQKRLLETFCQQIERALKLTSPSDIETLSKLPERYFNLRNKGSDKELEDFDSHWEDIVKRRMYGVCRIIPNDKKRKKFSPLEDDCYRDARGAIRNWPFAILKVGHGFSMRSRVVVVGGGDVQLDGEAPLQVPVLANVPAEKLQMFNSEIRARDAVLIRAPLENGGSRIVGLVGRIVGQ